ncbi:MAG: DUF177 domain-containing protein [Desulfuromonadales bacterium]|nr:DUF177 domain-containing protein [Desulfuromonadales bacterium]
MQIRVDQIKEGGLFLSFEEQVADFPALSVVDGDEVVFLAPLQISLRAIHVHGLVQIEGRAETEVRLVCGRCLKEFETPLVIPFSLTFSRDLPEAAADSEEEEGIEISAEEMGLIPFQGEAIDLREALQDQLVMGLPIRPLCQETCPGLCPQCGADLTLGDCGCERPTTVNRFDVLKNFKVDKE